MIESFNTKGTVPFASKFFVHFFFSWCGNYRSYCFNCSLSSINMCAWWSLESQWVDILRMIFKKGKCCFVCQWLELEKGKHLHAAHVLLGVSLLFFFLLPVPVGFLWNMRMSCRCWTPSWQQERQVVFFCIVLHTQQQCVMFVPCVAGFLSAAFALELKYYH